MHYVDHIPTTNSEALAKLERWFREQPEILVRTRMPCSGNEEFEFFLSFESLAEKMRALPPGTWFTIFEQPQLSLRGVVDDGFIARCLKSIPDGAEYLIVETVRRVAGRMSWFHNASGNSRAVLPADLESSRGNSVAVGLYPPSLEERDDVIQVFTPNTDGTVTTRQNSACFGIFSLIWRVPCRSHWRMITTSSYREHVRAFATRLDTRPTADQQCRLRLAGGRL